MAFDFNYEGYRCVQDVGRYNWIAFNADMDRHWPTYDEVANGERADFIYANSRDEIKDLIDRIKVTAEQRASFQRIFNGAHSRDLIQRGQVEQVIRQLRVEHAGNLESQRLLGQVMKMVGRIDPTIEGKPDGCYG